MYNFDMDYTMKAMHKLHYITDKHNPTIEQIQINKLNGDIKASFSKIARDRKKIRHIRKSLKRRNR